MPSFRQARVTEIVDERPGFVRVRLDDGSRAYALTQLTGPIAPDDDVVVNTTAVDLGLGSGGWHVVHWNLTQGPWSEPGAGHLMKLRYTSLQVDTGAGEEGGSVPRSLDGCPVIVAGVHSQLPVAAAAIGALRPGTRTAYVMTDGAALPLAMSDQVVALREAGLVCGTVSAGHAFGGDIEALNVASALSLARHRLDAEVVIVAMGPGIAGTASELGFTGLEVAPALDAAAWLDGRPICCLRCSDADPRARHRGISHHSRTVLDAVRSEVDVAVPPGVDAPAGRHRWHPIHPGDVSALLADAGLTVTTMGRGPDEDPLYFAAAAASGHLAVRLLPGDLDAVAASGPTTS
ncbi:DUF3866 family protein [Aquihabitans daechungensis]|uniref:DUF3866 family protein n=1 Tax=Aquihabitans daechungensis TaxID=1052257 RepID=UPI003BA2BE94